MKGATTKSRSVMVDLFWKTVYEHTCELRVTSPPKKNLTYLFANERRLKLLGKDHVLSLTANDR
jgi:hypothetical protein